MASIPAVKALEKRHHGRGLRTISVTEYDTDQRKLVADAVEKHGMEYPCYLDSDGEWLKRAGIKLIPVFVLIDKDGRVAYRHAGKLTEGTADYEALDAAIVKTLEAS